MNQLPYINYKELDEFYTVQQLAAQKAYLSKLKDNNGENPLNVYQKYYKRYFAR